MPSWKPVLHCIDILFYLIDLRCLRSCLLVVIYIVVARHFLVSPYFHQPWTWIVRIHKISGFTKYNSIAVLYGLWNMVALCISSVLGGCFEKHVLLFGLLLWSALQNMMLFSIFYGLVNLSKKDVLRSILYSWFFSFVIG